MCNTNSQKHEDVAKEIIEAGQVPAYKIKGTFQDVVTGILEKRYNSEPAVQEKSPPEPDLVKGDFVMNSNFLCLYLGGINVLGFCGDKYSTPHKLTRYIFTESNLSTLDNDELKHKVYVAKIDSGFYVVAEWTDGNGRTWATETTRNYPSKHEAIKSLFIKKIKLNHSDKLLGFDK